MINQIIIFNNTRLVYCIFRSSDDKVADIKMLFDQKAYLEEVNKNLK